MNRFAVILAGGKGERLWPLSRKNLPKQLINVVGDKTLIEQTVERNMDITEYRWILTTNELKNSFDFLKEYKVEVFAEPRGKNTLIAIGFMAALIIRDYGDGIMIVLPADHVISDIPKYVDTMKIGIKMAEKDYLVTYGIVPERPDTNYGYIEKGEKIENSVYKVKSFREKPGYKEASEYINSGNFFWNSGMFVWKASVIMEEIKQYQNGLYKLLDNVVKSDGNNLEDSIKELYDKGIATSIDYGIMEYSKRVAVVESRFVWDDVGSWLSIRRHYKEDEKGNVCVGDTYLSNSRDNILYSKDGLIVTVGVNDLIVVHTNDVTFVCKKEDISSIKDVLSDMNGIENLKKYL